MILSKPAAATSTLTTAWDFVAKNRKVIRYSLLAAAVWYYTRPAPKYVLPGGVFECAEHDNSLEKKKPQGTRERTQQRRQQRQQKSRLHQGSKRSR